MLVAHLTLIGYWRSESQPEWPDPALLVDRGWDPRERHLVATYLSSGMVPWRFLGYSRCRICGQQNGDAEYTDGTYIWPEGLSHYVADHAIRLPQPLVDHILREIAEYEPGVVEVDRNWWKLVTLSD